MREEYTRRHAPTTNENSATVGAAQSPNRSGWSFRPIDEPAVSRFGDVKRAVVDPALTRAARPAFPYRPILNLSVCAHLRIIGHHARKRLIVYMYVRMRLCVCMRMCVCVFVGFIGGEKDIQSSTNWENT